MDLSTDVRQWDCPGVGQGKPDGVLAGVESWAVQRPKTLPTAAEGVPSRSELALLLRRCPQGCPAGLNPTPCQCGW